MICTEAMRMKRQRVTRHFPHAPGASLSVGSVGPEEDIWRDPSQYRTALTLTGEARRTVGREQTALLSGDVFQLMAGETADIMGEHALFYVTALPAATGQALWEAGLIQRARSFPVKTQQYMENWMPHLIVQLRDTPEDKLFEAWLSIQRFVVHLHRLARIGQDSDPNAQMERAKQEIQSICCQEEPDMASVAALLGMKMETFRKRFKRVCGAAPWEYLLTCRFRQAGHMLQDGMSVQETAQRVGYRDPFVFSRQFRRQMGVPPSRWRREAPHTKTPPDEP